MALLLTLALRLAALLVPVAHAPHPRPVSKEHCDPDSDEADDARDWDDGDDEPDHC